MREPHFVDRERPPKETTFRYNCPFAQVWGHVARAGIDLKSHGITVLDPQEAKETYDLLKEIEKIE